MATEHLNGKRTGRPRGAKGKSGDKALRRDVLWAYRSLNAYTLKDGEPQPKGKRAPKPPSPGAWYWLRYALIDPDKFLDRPVMHVLVESKKKNIDEPEQNKKDEGTERALEVCVNWLEKLQAQQAKEDAELAARPNAAEIAGTLQKSLARALEREERLQERVTELERNGAAKASV